MKGASFPRKIAAFSLVELLVTMAVLTIIASALVTIVGNLSNYWISTQSRIQTFRNGRSALEFMARDLAALQQPLASRPDATSGFSPMTSGSPAPKAPGASRAYLQFIQDAGDANTGLSTLLETGFQQVSTSSNIFGQVRVGTSPQGDLAVLGYYLARSSDRKRYELRRLFVSPYANNSANPNYMIYSNNAQSTNNFSTGNSGSPAWLYRADFVNNSYPICENVIAFWVRCLDRLGNPIPWLKDNAQAGGSSAPFKFNSAAAFQMYSATNSSSTKSFVYMDRDNALPAHQLPAALEIILITVDSNALKKSTIPDMSDTPSTAADVPVKVAAYLKKLYDANIKSAKMFSTVVKLGDSQ